MDDEEQNVQPELPCHDTTLRTQLMGGAARGSEFEPRSNLRPNGPVRAYAGAGGAQVHRCGAT